MRVMVFAAFMCCAIVGVASAEDAHAMIRKPTNISAQALHPALQLLSKERDIQVVYRTDVVADVRTAGAVGNLTPDEALEQLLKGTGLTYRYLDKKTVTIIPDCEHHHRAYPIARPAHDIRRLHHLGIISLVSGLAIRGGTDRCRRARAREPACLS